MIRVLQIFQHLNLVPRYVMAEVRTIDLLMIQVEIIGLSEEHLATIVGKVGQIPSVVNAHLHRL